jgi:hypothetical protein
MEVTEYHPLNKKALWLSMILLLETQPKYEAYVAPVGGGISFSRAMSRNVFPIDSLLRDVGRDTH